MSKLKPTLMIFFFLSLISPCKAQNITTDILQRVFMLKYQGNIGSSFTIDVKNRQYLITAKHLVKGIKKGDTIEIFHDNSWMSIEIIPLYIEPEDVDIVVLALPKQISPAHPLKLTTDGSYLGQDLYFLGFPYGLNMDASSMNDGFPLPFVKKGICSAIYPSPKDDMLFYIDGINNPGFSGGPIISLGNPIKVLAVVSGYRNQHDKVYRKIKQTEKDQERDKAKEKLLETDMIVKSNSGLVMGYGIDSAFRIIEKNPIGAPINIR